MINLWKRRKRDANRALSRSEILLTLGKRDSVTLGDAFENTLILGSPGSGKTSGSGDAYCKSLVRLGLGGLVLTAKPSDAARWRRTCEIYGRSDDLIVHSQAVRAGLGIGFLADYVVRDDPTVQRVLPNLVLPELPMWITVHREIRTNPRIRAVFDFLAAALPDLI